VGAVKDGREEPVTQGASPARPPVDPAHLLEAAILTSEAVAMAEDRSVEPRDRIAAGRLAIKMGALLGRLLERARAATPGKGAAATMSHTMKERRPCPN
jgi:hypothetical protein